MTLVFFRHGIAVDRTGSQEYADPARPLTEKGAARVHSAALGLARLGLSLDRIFTSPWVRAAQTAEILCEVLGGSLRVEELPELAGDRSVDELLTALAGQSLPSSLLVGHQPLLGDTVARLLGARGTLNLELKKGGAAALELDGISPQVPATLLWLLTPRQLRWIGR